MTLQPKLLQYYPAEAPTAPAAPEIKTVFPYPSLVSLSEAISYNGNKADNPGIPNIPKK
jgi:hypothetical protein